LTLESLSLSPLLSFSKTHRRVLAEVERLGRELTSILGHVNTIAALPIADVPPTKHSHENADSLRPDVSRPGVSRDEALRNAPDPTADGFRVPPIGA
jgi:aspartyl-tRNA(Asn)/glutamyl-tRNA(Gln) amidotransferase subunit C